MPERLSACVVVASTSIFAGAERGHRKCGPTEHGLFAGAARVDYPPFSPSLYAAV